MTAGSLGRPLAPAHRCPACRLPCVCGLGEDGLTCEHDCAAAQVAGPFDVLDLPASIRGLLWYDRGEGRWKS